MPLVGVDWSQNGVAHLFSAIKVFMLLMLVTKQSYFQISISLPDLVMPYPLISF